MGRDGVLLGSAVLDPKVNWDSDPSVHFLLPVKIKDSDTCGCEQSSRVIYEGGFRKVRGLKEREKLCRVGVGLGAPEGKGC